jgi:polysaccharide biosynthesis protein PslH
LKILFVTIGGIKNSDYGGGLISNNNLYLLKKMYGSENVTFYSCIDRSNLTLLQRIKFVFFHNEDVQYINTISSSFDCIFLDCSLLGNLVKPIKKHCPNIKFVTFFHNIELLYYAKTYFTENKSYNYFIKILNLSFIALCERYAIKHSDGVIFMTNRNDKTARKIYGNPNYSQVLGLYITDDFKNEGPNNYFKENGVLKLLFVGSNVSFNVNGLKWFVKNVIPHVDVRLFIVGKEMETLRDVFDSEKIEVIGSVKDLSPYYYSADIVISPILIGEGMKVKVAEALMYGKTIFGTKESFEGYDIEIDKVGKICQDPDDFIEAIRSYKYFQNLNGINKKSRIIFLNNYSINQYEQNLFYFFNKI